MNNLQENINLLNDILNRNFYYYFKKDDNNKKIVIQFFNDNNYNDSWIIPNYQKKEVNNQEIINNFISFLDWYKNNNFLCDIVIDDYYWLNDENFRQKIFNILFMFLKDYKYNLNIFITNPFKNFYKKDFLFIENQIKKFQNMESNIFFTIQTNGKYIDNYFDEYYELLFNLINKYNFIIKVKIIPEKIEKYKDNYLWLTKKINNLNNLILYEEETENWKEDKIQKYLSFINFYIDNFNGDILKQIFDENNYSFINLSDKKILKEENPYGKCKMFQNLNILIENLSINLCKKFHYDDLFIGKFEIKNKKITQCIPNNLPTVMIPAHTKRYILPKCECCHFIGLCNGYCHGEAYKVILNPLIPIMESCEMRKAKFAFIFYKLKNLLKEEKLNNYISTEYYKEYILDISNNIINNINGENNVQ